MIELHELSLNDGEEIFKMVREIGEKENGFINNLFSSSFSLFQEKLRENYNLAKGINLKPNYVPQTIYWLFVDGKPVGYGKLRHYLNESLLQHGGHIGYVISPNHRGNGYAKKLLEKLLKKANEIGINQVLLTTDDNNIPSRRSIEDNNGMLDKVENGSCFYWVHTSS
ncbi:MAG TPA: GNAT family N-acetyltransferase [Sphingobacterium sp.]|nr:GNAT family N-acetyltransferase [Sphingobacterium sp.]